MRIDRALLAAVLALLLVAAAIAWLLPEPPDHAGRTHPDFPTMNEGGDGRARHGDRLLAGWAFGLLSIVTFVLLIALGARRRDALGEARGPLLIGFAAYAAVFTGMMLAYRAYLDDPNGPMILGFPPPSAIMLYVLYPVSALFNVYYVVRFRSWVLTEEDEAEYERLLAEHAAGEGGP